MEKVIILDFGSQYTQVLAKKIRKFSVYCEVVPYNIPIEVLTPNDVKAIILSGGPKSVYEKHSFQLNFNLVDLISLNKPILGICYGMQLIVNNFGGVVNSKNSGEYGSAQINLLEKSKLFNQIPDQLNVWMSHSDFVLQIPKDFKVIASNSNNPYVALEKDHIYLVQFHPEVYHTDFSDQILSNFLFEIVKINPSWQSNDISKEIIAYIQNKVKNEIVICAISGGVDSIVTAALLNKALRKNQVHCVFVDHGFLRFNEEIEVKNVLSNFLNLNLEVITARDLFLSEIAGVKDPEEKRKIIGKTFISIFEEQALKNKAKFLVQGTLYSDIIESQGSKFSDKIKSHHNVGGLPENMNLQLVEPLKKLFKDEVRTLGLNLNIPEEMILRHPFPGPGLAIRILGNITQKKLDILKKADYIAIQEIKKANVYNKIWQAFVVLLSDHTVGIMGDARTYGYTVALRFITSVDGMTADWYKCPYEILETISKKIVNQIPEINRVLYDLSSKPPATIEWE